MSRLPAPDLNSFDETTRRAYEEIVRVRGQVRGPFAIWLSSPGLCERALALQDWFPKHATLERRLLELMILTLARRSTAQFAWFIHEKHAVRCGVSPLIVADIRERRTPTFDRDDERLVYDVTNELDENKKLSPTTFKRAVELLGPTALVELVSAVGFYVMVAMTLNSFDVEIPEGQPPLEA